MKKVFRPLRGIIFFCGKLMFDRDFWAEQLYHIRKQKLHNTYLHGWGTVCCLSGY